MKTMIRLSMLIFLFCILISGAACDSDSGDDDDDDYYADDDGGLSDDDDADWGDDDASSDDDGWGDDDAMGDDDVADDDAADDDDDDDEDDDTTDDDTFEEYPCPEETDDTVLYLSADDSNSQASPVIARRLIEDGHMVPRRWIRTYEFTNYYQIDYAKPAQGRITIVPQMRLHDDGSEDGYRTYIMQIGAQSHSLAMTSGRHLNVTFSLDTSGSMEGEAFQRLKYVVRAIVARLKAGDIVSIVEWDNNINVVLDSRTVNGPSDPVVLDAINELEVGGSTDLHGGLTRAYALAEENFDAERMNRVVLISDGMANTGVTDIELIAEAADDSEGEGIYLLGVGVGNVPGSYEEHLMDEVTDAGKGAYVYIDTQSEADKQFGDRFQENMEIAAMAVQVRLQMPYYLLMEQFYGEEYSGDPQEVEPQHLGPNDAMVFAQYLAVCDDSVLSGQDLINVQAHYTNPITREEHVDEAEFTIAQLLGANASQLIKGDAIVAYAEALKEISKLYQEGNYQQALEVCETARVQVAAAAEQLNDDELTEIADLLVLYGGTISKKLK